MQLLGLAAISATAMLSMVQYAPAPFLLLTEAAVDTMAAVASADGALGGAALGGAASASVAHGISSSTRRSPIDLPAGVSEHSWDLCKGELDGAHVKFSGTTNLRLDGLPAACMDLATVLTGDPTQDGGPVPTPMGSAAIEYSDLTDEEWHQVYNALKEHGYTSTS